MSEARPKGSRVTLEQAEADLSNAVYRAALLFERWEYAGLVRGNGHHAAQAVARTAVEELRSRWIEADRTPSPNTGEGS